LWIEERGTSGDLSEVWIRCDCGKAERSVFQAADMKIRALGQCDGNRPWLGPWSKEKCGEPNRLLIRTASNAILANPVRLTQRERLGDWCKLDAEFTTTFVQHWSLDSYVQTTRFVLNTVR